MIDHTRELLGSGFRVFALSDFDRGMFESGDGVYIETRLASRALDRSFRG